MSFVQATTLMSSTSTLPTSTLPTSTSPPSTSPPSSSSNMPTQQPPAMSQHELLFCEESELWRFFESWFTPFSRCFEWTMLCYVPFVYLLLAATVWVTLVYARLQDRRSSTQQQRQSQTHLPVKRLSLWTPLQLMRSTLAAILMLVFFASSLIGEAKFYRALYAENRGEWARFVPIASILYDVVGWLSCIVVLVLHHLHRDIGHHTSVVLTSYWSLLAVFHLPSYYRTWMDLFHPQVESSMSTKSVVLHTVTYPLIVASLVLNVVMYRRRQPLSSQYSGLASCSRRRSMTR